MKMKYPFEATFSEIEAAPEPFVSAVFSSLASEFLTLPKGDGFVDYAAFEAGYEALKKATGGFVALPKPEVLKTVLHVPIAFVVLRSMLGFTPPEWAYVAAQRSGSELNQALHERSTEKYGSLRWSLSTQGPRCSRNESRRWLGQRAISWRGAVLASRLIKSTGSKKQIPLAV